MTRVEDFIKLYNEVDQYLRQITGADRSKGFTHVIDLATSKHPVVRARSGQLKDWGDLRNLIVHHRDFPKSIVAEPTEQSLADFRDVGDKLLSPKRLIPTFQVTNLRCFTPDEPLTDALADMRQQDYSQVVVQATSQPLNLLTVEGVSRWLAAQAAADIISVREATIGQVLAYESSDHWAMMRREQPVYDALDLFARSIELRRPRLFAIVVTANGKPQEKPLGIVTPWDLMELSLG